MTLRHMTIFCAVYENGCNTTKAAAALNMSQPAISLAIHELEDYYGIVLFDRYGKRLKISEAGQRFYGYASYIITLFRDMELTMKNMDKTGTVRIGASIAIGADFLPVYVKAFKDKYPDAHIKVTVGPNEQLEKMLASSDLDFALSEGLIHNPDIIAENYMDDRLVIICSTENPLKQKKQLTLDEFKSQSFLLGEKRSASRELFDAVTKQAGIVIDPVWESSSAISLINGVIKNLGISVLPERLVQNYILNGCVSVLQVEELSFERTFKVIYHKDKLITPTLKDFITLCKTHKVNHLKSAEMT